MMSGTNGSGVLGGVNGTARRVAVEVDYKAEYVHMRGLADAYLVERNRVGRLHLEQKAKADRLASELATVQAECCRLTDVNGDLAAELGRLRKAATCVIGSGKLYPLEVNYREAWLAVPGYRLGDLQRAVTREARPEATEADVIDPEWQLSQPSQSVNARLFAAAKAVDASSDDHLIAGSYGGDWTGVGDDALVELTEAIEAAEAAQREGEAAEAPEADEPANCGGVNSGQIIREQSEVIKALSRVESAARDFRAAWKSGEPLQGFYQALDFALDGLPTGEGEPCEPAKPHCDAPCQPCQPQAPCPERVHMLAVAARNLILAWRGGRFGPSEVHTLDFALDGLI